MPESARDTWILLRGLTRGRIHWASFPDELARQSPGSRVITLDLPGNGDRSRETFPLSPAPLIDDLRRQLQKEGVGGGPVRLCGISLGGMVAAHWAWRDPERFASVAVINTSFAGLSPWWDRFSVPRYLTVLKLLASRKAADRENGVLAITSNRPDRMAAVRESFIRFAQVHPVERSNFFRQLILASRLEFPADLRVPVTVIGSLSDRLVNPRCSMSLARKLKVSAHLHPTAGHDLPLDEPEWLAALLVQSVNGEKSLNPAPPPAQ